MTLKETVRLSLRGMAFGVILILFNHIDQFSLFASSIIWYPSSSQPLLSETIWINILGIALYLFILLSLIFGSKFYEKIILQSLNQDQIITKYSFGTIKIIVDHYFGVYFIISAFNKLNSRWLKIYDIGNFQNFLEQFGIILIILTGTILILNPSKIIKTIFLNNIRMNKPNI